MYGERSPLLLGEGESIQGSPSNSPVKGSVGLTSYNRRLLELMQTTKALKKIAGHVQTQPGPDVAADATLESHEANGKNGKQPREESEASEPRTKIGGWRGNIVLRSTAKPAARARNYLAAARWFIERMAEFKELYPKDTASLSDFNEKIQVIEGKVRHTGWAGLDATYKELQKIVKDAHIKFGIKGDDGSEPEVTLLECFHRAELDWKNRAGCQTKYTDKTRAVDATRTTISIYKLSPEQCIACLNLLDFNYEKPLSWKASKPFAQRYLLKLIREAIEECFKNTEGYGNSFFKSKQLIEALKQAPATYSIALVRFIEMLSAKIKLPITSLRFFPGLCNAYTDEVTCAVSNGDTITTTSSVMSRFACPVPDLTLLVPGNQWDQAMADAERVRITKVRIKQLLLDRVPAEARKQIERFGRDKLKDNTLTLPFLVESILSPKSIRGIQQGVINPNQSDNDGEMVELMQRAIAELQLELTSDATAFLSVDGVNVYLMLRYNNAAINSFREGVAGYALNRPLLQNLKEQIYQKTDADLKVFLEQWQLESIENQDNETLKRLKILIDEYTRCKDLDLYAGDKQFNRPLHLAVIIACIYEIIGGVGVCCKSGNDRTGIFYAMVLAVRVAIALGINVSMLGDPTDFFQLIIRLEEQGYEGVRTYKYILQHDAVIRSYGMGLILGLKNAKSLMHPGVFIFDEEQHFAKYCKELSTDGGLIYPKGEKFTQAVLPELKDYQPINLAENPFEWKKEQLEALIESVTTAYNTFYRHSDAKDLLDLSTLLDVEIEGLDNWLLKTLGFQNKQMSILAAISENTRIELQMRVKRIGLDSALAQIVTKLDPRRVGLVENYLAGELSELRYNKDVPPIISDKERSLLTQYSENKISLDDVFPQLLDLTTLPNIRFYLEKAMKHIEEVGCIKWVFGWDARESRILQNHIYNLRETLEKLDERGCKLHPVEQAFAIKFRALACQLQVDEAKQTTVSDKAIIDSKIIALIIDSEKVFINCKHANKEEVISIELTEKETKELKSKLYHPRVYSEYSQNKKVKNPNSAQLRKFVDKLIISKGGASLFCLTNELLRKLLLEYVCQKERLIIASAKRVNQQRLIINRTSDIRPLPYWAINPVIKGLIGMVFMIFGASVTAGFATAYGKESEDAHSPQHHIAQALTYTWEVALGMALFLATYARVDAHRAHKNATAALPQAGEKPSETCCQKFCLCCESSRENDPKSVSEEEASLSEGHEEDGFDFGGPSRR